MSQFPDPNNPPVPLPYAQTGYRPPKLRPTSVTVLAIIGISLGSLMVLGSLCNTLQFVGISLNGDNPVLKAMQDDHILFVWSVIGVIVNLVLGGLLLGGSVWSLSLKLRGRSWLIAYSWLDIGFTLFSLGISVGVVLPRVDHIVRNSNFNQTIRMFMQLSMWGGLAFSLVMLVFPALILYFMSRPLVKEAFRRGLVAPAQQWGVGNP